MDENVISISQLFLLPAAVLFAAVGVATKRQVRTLASIVGFIMSTVWAIRLWLLPVATPNKYPLDGVPAVDIRLATALAAGFVIAYAVCSVVNAIEWNKQRNASQSEPSS